MRLLPLGGLGEIGRNCLLVELERDAILVDCGVQFPGPEVHGVDVILPDFGPLLARRDKLRAILVTHGHEDHLGAVPYLLRELALPVYASPLTLKLLEHKLRELELTATVHPLIPRQVVTLGEFRIEPLRVTHSIPDSLAFAIGTPEGTLFHSGDFKIDRAPIDGELTDLDRFAELGNEGVVCVLSDSTNANRDGSCPGEIAVAPALRELIATAPARVVVALFASNLHRIQQVLDLCAALGRKVALSGRALERNFELGAEIGRLRVPPGLLVKQELAAALPAKEVCVLSTGAQGEPRSGLNRLARGEHGVLFLEAGDRVILSASLIPGNEVAVYGVVNRLARMHVETFQEPSRHVIHVSGHAYRDDQKLLLELLKPKSFIPVHGEARHLAAHRALALECGVPPDRCLEVYDGDWVEVGRDVARVAGTEPLKIQYLERLGGGSEVAEEVVRDRRTLADAGLVTAVVQLNRETLALSRPIQLVARGLSRGEGSRFLPAATEELTRELEALPAALKLDSPALEEVIVKALRRVAKRELERRPVVVPVVLRV